MACVTTLPYLYDRSFQGLSPVYGWYTWFAFNVPDGCVYLSWMRQYADGAWFHRNLFTTLPQSGHQLNLLFLVLGKLSGLSGLHPLVLYHLCRVVAAFLVPWLLWRLMTVLGFRDPARRYGVWITVLGAGLGWLPGLWERGFAGPVDVWQPEAVTFLSLYLMPLFGVSMALMLAVLINLIESEQRQSLRHAAWAGLWGFVLANVHTYDVLPLAVVWLAMIALAVGARWLGRPLSWPQVERGLFGRVLAAGIPTTLSGGYMLWVYRTEEVFARRVATETLSPALHWVLLGFGLLVPLAFAGAISIYRARGSHPGLRSAVLFLCLWAILHVVVSYLPVPFQRKMLMGAQWPVGILAGVGLAAAFSRVPVRLHRAALALTITVLALTNVRFMLRDRGVVRHGGDTVRAYLLDGEVRALEWLRRNTPRDTVVQPLPWIAVGPEGRVGFVDTTVACFAPGLTGRAVDAGHWGETPDYGRTMTQWLRFLLPETSDEWRRELLRRTGVRYVVFSQKREETRDPSASAILAASGVLSRLSYLKLIPEASHADADVYEVVAP